MNESKTVGTKEREKANGLKHRSSRKIKWFWYLDNGEKNRTSQRRNESKDGNHGKQGGDTKIERRKSRYRLQYDNTLYWNTQISPALRDTTTVQHTHTHRQSHWCKKHTSRHAYWHCLPSTHTHNDLPHSPLRASHWLFRAAGSVLISLNQF